MKNVKKRKKGPTIRKEVSLNLAKILTWGIYPIIARIILKTQVLFVCMPRLTDGVAGIEKLVYGVCTCGCINCTLIVFVTFTYLYCVSHVCRFTSADGMPTVERLV